MSIARFTENPKQVCKALILDQLGSIPSNPTKFQSEIQEDNASIPLVTRLVLAGVDLPLVGYHPPPITDPVGNASHACKEGWVFLHDFAPVAET